VDPGDVNFLSQLSRSARRGSTLDRASVVATITRQKASLCSAMAAAEETFLSLSRQMQAMSQTAEVIARLASEILVITAGAGKSGALHEAVGTFEKLLGRIAERKGHYTKILERLRDIGDRTAANLGTREALSRALFAFGPLAMEFRIEIARLGEGEAKRFLALAQSIAGAQSQAQSCSDGYFAALGGILQYIESTAVRLAAYGERLTQDVSQTRRSVDARLRSLKQRWAQSAKIGADADSAVRDIVAQIGKIVVATQYQDIAHQQIEHIISALTEIQGEVTRGGDRQQTSKAELALYVRQSCLVQCQQMNVVADEIGRASQTIVQGMRRILDSAGRLSHCPGREEAPGEDLVEAFRNDIRTMADLDEAGLAISNDLAAWIGPAAAALSASGAKMQEYSIRIRFTAINAQVEAHRSDRGKVLEILAGELRTAANASFDVIDQMSRFLVDIIRDLNGDLEESRKAAMAEADQSRRETRHVTDLLEQAQTELREKSAELTSRYRRLAEDTQKTIATAKPHETVVIPVLAAKAAIEALVNSFELDDQGEVSSTDLGRIAALRSRYTMEGERNVHDLVTAALQRGRETPPAMQGAHAVVAAAAATPLPSAAGGLGDNVELF